MLFYARNPFFRRVAIVVLLDLACLIGAAFAAWVLAPPETQFVFFAGATLLVGIGAVLTLQTTGAYDLTTLGDGRRTWQAVLGTMGLALVGALLVYFYVPLPAGSEDVLVRSAAIFFPLLIAERYLFRAISGVLRKRILLVGASDLAFALAGAIDSRKGLGLEVMGILSDEPEHQGAHINGYNVVGTIHSLEKVMHEGRADWVVVTSQSRADHFPEEQLLQLKTRGVPIISGVLLYELIVGEIYHRALRSSYLIFDDGFRVSRFGQFVKRCLDLTVSSIALVLTAPVMLGACLAIRIESKGPVFFRQTRLGRGDEPFELIKLRSMDHGAEEDTGPVFARRGDPRITRVGGFLRRTRIDELPQLWNVIKGEMSIVGPRPARPEFVEELSERFPYFRLRSTHKPGVTGWAQIRYGYAANTEAFERKLALDLYYLKHPSLLLDLSIIWKTLRTVFSLGGV